MAVKLKRQDFSRVLSNFNDLVKKLHLTLRLLLAARTFNLQCFHTQFFAGAKYIRTQNFRY